MFKQSLKGLSTRAAVIKTLVAIQQGTSLASLRDDLLATVPEQDNGFANELLLGTLRQWFALSRISGTLSNYPIDNHGVLAGLHIGMYQLLYMRVADHAAISETVEAIKQVGEANAAGLVNAILRKVQTKQSKWQKKVVSKHSLPNWLAKQLKQDWSAEYDDLTQNLRQTAPLFLRVNQRQTTQSDYLALLQQADIQAQAMDKHGICVLDNVRITQLPLFESGGFSVQDINAQKTVALFSDLTNKTVLDACAAPGGKTAHLLESHDVACLTALDNDANRLLLVGENLERLDLLTVTDDLQILCADATKAKDWGRQTKAKTQFDAILIDAPCTATGVIRRHPDIALLRTEADVAKTADLQARILDNLWQHLKVGGELVYVTCSLLKSENTEQIANFLSRTQDAKEEKIHADWGVEQPHGRQCLPIQTLNDEKQGDGFYFAKLIKV